MSANPQDMQQMLAQYKALYGNPQMQGLNQIQHSLGAGAPPGTNTTAGGVNSASQLIMALLKAQKQKQLQQQVSGMQGQIPMTPSQGQTTSTPTPDMSANPVGVP